MSSIGSNKKYPATINDKKNIIFENNNSKFHIPDKYKNFYIVSKLDYFKFKNELESIEKVNPILKNEEDKIVHLNFSRLMKLNIKKKPTLDLYIKDDASSHLTKSAHTNFFTKNILYNLNILINEL